MTASLAFVRVTLAVVVALAAALGVQCIALARPQVGALPPSRDGGRVTLVAGGDVLLDRGVRAAYERAGDRFHPFEGIASILQGADIAFANLECPLTREGNFITKRFQFRGDPEMAVELRRAGFTCMSLANNHAYDCGRDALLETAAHLESAGITPIGAGPTLDHAATPRIVTIGEQRIALLAFVDMPLEGLLPLSDQPGPAFADPTLVDSAIRAAREAADWVVVSVHWGQEGNPEPTDGQVLLANRMVAAGADLVLGHHPHVLQPVRRVGQSIVFYSLGNLVFDQSRREQSETILVRAEMGVDRERSIAVRPMRIRNARPEAVSGEAAAAIVDRLVGSGPVEFTQGPDDWWSLRFLVP